MEERVVIINGSYREDGISEQMVYVIEAMLQEKGISFYSIKLRDKTIHFCDNCRHCMHAKGTTPGRCHHQDAMDEIIASLEEGVAYIFISPTNMGTTTALYKCFLERLSVYAYWPWGASSPKFRKSVFAKKALCLSSCAAPSLLGWLFFDTMKLLKLSAKCVGAQVIDTMYLGYAAQERAQLLKEKEKQKLRQKVLKLLA